MLSHLRHTGIFCVRTQQRRVGARAATIAQREWHNKRGEWKNGICISLSIFFFLAWEYNIELVGVSMFAAVIYIHSLARPFHPLYCSTSESQTIITIVWLFDVTHTHTQTRSSDAAYTLSKLIYEKVLASRAWGLFPLKTFARMDDAISHRRAISAAIHKVLRCVCVFILQHSSVQHPSGIPG